jgi:hypothetical protein
MPQSVHITTENETNVFKSCVISNQLSFDAVVIAEQASKAEQMKVAAFPLNSPRGYVCAGYAKLAEDIAHLCKEAERLRQDMLELALKSNFERGKALLRDTVQSCLEDLYEAITSSLPYPLSCKCTIQAMVYAYVLACNVYPLRRCHYSRVDLNEDELNTIAQAMESHLASRHLSMKAFDMLFTYGNGVVQYVSSTTSIKDLMESIDQLEISEAHKIELVTMVNIVRIYQEYQG